MLRKNPGCGVGDQSNLSCWEVSDHWFVGTAVCKAVSIKKHLWNGNEKN